MRLAVLGPATVCSPDAVYAHEATTDDGMFKHIAKNQSPKVTASIHGKVKVTPRMKGRERGRETEREERADSWSRRK